MKSSKKIRKGQVEAIDTTDISSALGYIPENINNKQNSLAVDNTGVKYPTVDAVNTHVGDTNNPHNVTKSQVGLGNVDNTSDINKPVSTATQNALNLKANDSNVIHTSGDEVRTGSLTSDSFIKNGGTASQFLKANGSSDSTTYENAANKGIANGYASLDSGGKVPVAQLPNSIMEYKGVYNASTNTPTLTDGIGDTGDVYKTTVAGSGVNALGFVVGDYAIYNGTTWEKAHSGADAVTSVFGRSGAVTAQSGDYTASQIANIASGNIVSTNVQAALNEMDSKKAPIEVRTPVNDANYTISGSGNFLIVYTNITADRTVSLPPATTSNQRIWITDESGLCSNVRRIIVSPFAGDSIGGDSFAVINFPNGSGYLESNGTGKWNIISTTSVQFSSGVNTMPTITDNGNGSVTLGTGVYSLFANVNGTGRPKAYQVVGGTFTLTDNSLNFIYAEYNTTTGLVSLQQTTTESSLNDLTQILVYSAYRQGVTLHPRNFDTWGIALANKLNRSVYRTQRVRIEEGGVLLGESASPAARTITISAGTVWVAAAENPLIAITSAANSCYFVYHSAGVWQTTSIVTQYNNTQYDDGTNLQTLPNGRYAVNWVYRSIGTDNDMAIVLGNSAYTLGNAQISAKPTNLPTFLRHMELIGRIIVQKNDAVATQIDNVSSTTFTSAGVTDHEALNNLQGGVANEHYHLTQAQYNTLTTGSVRPYTTYTALFSQSGTSAPTVNPMENTIGPIVWTRLGVGDYIGTLSGAFSSLKTHCIATMGTSNPANRIVFGEDTTNTVRVKITDSSGTLIDSGISFGYIEIKNYP